MIIGISGKKQSGKDTVGKIIQFLKINNCNPYYNDKPYSEKSFSEYLSNKDNEIWEIKKFSDKLKDIVCLLINCTRQELEDEKFKNTAIGEEWIRMYFDKDFSYKKQCFTPRELLQFIGTDLFREKLNPNIWVNSLMCEYKKTIRKTTPTFESVTTYPDWIITDVRFQNEFQAIKDRGGITIRVNRPQLPNCDNHLSETDLDSVIFDYTIDNNGTIEELIKKVQKVLYK